MALLDELVAKYASIECERLSMGLAQKSYQQLRGI